MPKRASKIAGFKGGPVIVQCRLIPGLEVSVDPAGRSPLRYAALSNDHAEVTRLIAAGETPDSPESQGFTPLHLGIQEHAIAAATALLNQSASVDQTNTFGTTPLFVVVFTSHGQAERINLLRSRGADQVHANVTGQTPLGLARLISRRGSTFKVSANPPVPRERPQAGPPPEQAPPRTSRSRWPGFRGRSIPI